MAKEAKEYMLLLYKKEEDRLYGFIRFYKENHPGQEEFNKPYRDSNPFAIGTYLPNGQVEVIGSVIHSLQELRRIFGSFVLANNKWHEESVSAGKPISRLDAVYRNAVMDHTVLVAVHARNVMDIFPRLRNWTIPRSGYDNKPDGGKLELRQVFDVLIHNRYSYFDGSHVRDLLSDRQTPTGRFMGYGFDISDFFRAVLKLVEDVTVKDWTKFLRQRAKHLSANSKPHQIIPVVQNVEALYSILRSRDDLREKFHELISSIVLNMRLGPQVVALQNPSVKIAPDLGKRQVEVKAQGAVGNVGQSLGEDDLKEHSATIGLDDFLGRLDRAFGSSSLVPGTYEFTDVKFS